MIKTEVSSTTDYLLKEVNPTKILKMKSRLENKTYSENEKSSRNIN